MWTQTPSHCRPRLKLTKFQPWYCAVIRRSFRTLPTLLSGVTCLVLCLAVHCVAFASKEAAKRPRITGIDHVTIYVSDVAKSQQFYSDALGLTIGCPQYTGPDTCYLVRPWDQRIVLKPTPAEMRNDAHKSWLAEIAFVTDDVWRLRDYLLAHGYHPGTVQESSDGARSFRMRDPEGNAIAFVQRLPPKIGYGPSSAQISTRLITQVLWSRTCRPRIVSMSTF